MILGAIFGMRIKNRSGKREFQLQKGEGSRGFESLDKRIARG